MRAKANTLTIRYSYIPAKIPTPCTVEYVLVSLLLKESIIIYTGILLYASIRSVRAYRCNGFLNIYFLLRYILCTRSPSTAWPHMSLLAEATTN